ncbi:MAG: hypothetical protein RLZZ565_1247, partial [Planctomycetota bacterium]
SGIAMVSERRWFDKGVGNPRAGGLSAPPPMPH